ncbi:MAG: ABC transporter permease, partial [Chloroflexota bacterium]
MQPVSMIPTEPVGAPTVAEPDPLGPSARRRRLRRILLRPSTLIALIGVLVLLVLTFLGSRLTPYDPEAIDPINQFTPPTWSHLFGTDDLGKDVFSRVIAGTHYSLTAVVVVLAIALILGLIVGSIAGYAGGLVEEILMRVTDIFLAFPGIVL